MSRFIVELHEGCWLEKLTGTTLLIKNARKYKTEREARIALDMARTNYSRTFARGRVLEVSE